MLGKKAAVITLVIDIGKGVVAVLAGGLIAGHAAAMWCALAAFIGHIWPVVFRFKGGKGVAVAFGALLAVNWQLALALLLIEAIVVLLTRMVSLGSIITAASCPVLCPVYGQRIPFFWMRYGRNPYFQAQSKHRPPDSRRRK